MKCWKSWGVKGVGGARVVDETDGRSISALLDFMEPDSANVKFRGERWAAEALRTPAYRELRLCVDFECLIELPAPELGIRLVGEREDMEVEAASDRVLEVPMAAGRGRLRLAARSSSFPDLSHDPPRFNAGIPDSAVQIPIPFRVVDRASDDSRREIEMLGVCIGYCML